METWAWLAAYLIGFALLQLFLYRYLRQGESTHERADEGREPGYRRLERAGARVETGRDSHEGDGQDGIRCRHCGAHNDPEGGYTYCRKCVQPLQ